MSTSPTSSKRQESDRITGDEDLLRAITTAHYDAKKGRTTSALFRGRDISVSRPSILPVERIEEIFIRTLPRPEKDPPIAYFGFARVETTTLRSLGEEYDAAEAMTVWAAPLPENEAHAEVAGDITRGLSKKILGQSEIVLRRL